MRGSNRKAAQRIRGSLGGAQRHKTQILTGCEAAPTRRRAGQGVVDHNTMTVATIYKEMHAY